MPDNPTLGAVDDYFWAAEPVRMGALGTGEAVVNQWVWRDRCMGVTIYQRVDLTDRLLRGFAHFMRDKPPPQPKRHWWSR